MVGFSASLYVLASKHLHRQADERLEAAINTLAAAAEVNQAGVEWEPSERTLSFGRRAVEGSFLWRVADDRGRPIDGSGGGDHSDRVLGIPGPVSESDRRPTTVVDRSGTSWRVLHTRLRSPDFVRDLPRVERDGRGRFFDSLWLTAAVSLGGVHESLTSLALVLCGLSTGIWAATLALGGRLCRRALSPLSAMAEAAQAIGGDHADGRLPLPGTGDELEDLGRSFNALLDRLQDSFERQRRFTGDASHQLRTPLTAVLGHVDLALRQKRSAEDYERALALVQRKARQMRGMVEALLFLARSDAESGRPELQPFELADWLEDHIAARHDPRRSADLRLEVGDNGPYEVLAHPSFLGGMLDNLIDNACKYSDPGTPITVRLGCDGASISLAVEDRGIGIDEADLPNVFEPFYRSAAARGRAAGGVGLGLSIARRLAGSMEATIEATVRSGGGSSFVVRFPRRPIAGSVGDVETVPATGSSDSRS
jgi:signal transduction histidine kinase